jgi:hypothetical protein
VGEVDLDGRRFAAVRTDRGGQVDGDTVFHYRQRDDLVEATYAGGRIRRGTLIGTRAGDELDFRYVHLDVDGATASGRCHTRVEVLPDGRVRLHETWTWESRPGEGRSVLEELRDDG